MANVTKGLTGNPEVDSKLQSLKNIGYVVESCTVGRRDLEVEARKMVTRSKETDEELKQLNKVGFSLLKATHYLPSGEFKVFLKKPRYPTADDYVKDIKEQIRDHPRFELNREPGPSDNVTRPSDTQVGGSHYKNMPIQPVKFITANDLGFCEGNVVKYICRYKEKGQVEDLQKAKHYIDLLIESME